MWIFRFDDANGEPAQSSDVFWSEPGAYSAAVFIIVPIDNVMAAVFNTPVAAVGGEQLLRVGLLRSSTGDAIGDFTGVFSAFFICGLPLDEKSLSDVRKVQIVVKFGCGPDFSNFYPAVVRGGAMDKIRVLPVFKV